MQVRAMAAMVFVVGGAVQAQVGDLYWTETGTKRVMTMDTQGTSWSPLASTPSGLFAIDADRSAQKVFFTDGQNNINRVNMDGTGLTTILTNAAPGGALGIALDDVNKKVWWSDWTSGDVMNANYDGTGAQLVFNAGPTVGGMVIDPAGGKIYMATKAAIKSANMNGTGLTTLYAPASRDFLDIALDPVNQKLYWTDNLNHKVQRSDLNGANVQDILTTGLGTPIGIDVDPLLGEFYVANKGASTIVSASLNGSNAQVLYHNHLSQTWGLAVVVPSPGAAAVLGLGGLAAVQRRRR